MARPYSSLQKNDTDPKGGERACAGGKPAPGFGGRGAVRCNLARETRGGVGMWRTKMILVAGVVAAILAGCSREVEVTRADAIRAATATVGTDRIRAADTEPGNWLAHGPHLR